MVFYSLNLVLRFTLEVSALVVMGMWGWSLSDSLLRFVLALGVPSTAAVIWGTCNVANDPSRSGNAPVVVPGIVRLTIELGFFAITAGMLYQLGYSTLATLFAAVVLVHYLASYERILWLLQR